MSWPLHWLLHILKAEFHSWETNEKVMKQLPHQIVDKWSRRSGKEDKVWVNKVAGFVLKEFEFVQSKVCMMNLCRRIGDMLYDYFKRRVKAYITG